MKRKLRDSVFRLTPTEEKILPMVLAGTPHQQIKAFLGWANPNTSIGPIVEVTLTKHRRMLADERAKSHEPTSLHAAHGRSLEPFIR